MNFQQTLQQLQARRETLKTRLSSVERDASHRDEPLSADFAEQAVERENDEVLDAIGMEAQHELALIDKAILRLQDDRYQECEECGGDIASQRLQAVPFTDLCIECAERQEALSH